METPTYLQSCTPSTTSTTCSTPHHFNSGDSYWKIAAELQYRSRCFVEALNGRAFGRFSQLVGPEHIDTNFTAYLDNSTLDLGWDEFVSVLRDAAEADPEYHADIINQSVDLDEREGHATVFMFIEVTGRPKSVRREDALVFEWKTLEGTWMCYGHTAIRGASGVRIAEHG